MRRTKCVEHHLCHPSSHLLSQRKDSDSEITEFCPRTEEANNTNDDGDSSKDSFPFLSFSRRLGPQSVHCVLRGWHNGPLMRLIVSGMHVKTRRLNPLFVAFWQSRGADLHPEDSVTVFWSLDKMVCLHSYTSYVAHCSLVLSYLWLAAGDGRGGGALWPTCELGHRENDSHSYSHTAEAWTLYRMSWISVCLWERRRKKLNCLTITFLYGTNALHLSHL